LKRAFIAFLIGNGERRREEESEGERGKRGRDEKRGGAV